MHPKLTLSQPSPRAQPPHLLRPRAQYHARRARERVPELRALRDEDVRVREGVWRGVEREWWEVGVG